MRRNVHKSILKFAGVFLVAVLFLDGAATPSFGQTTKVMANRDFLQMDEYPSYYQHLYLWVTKEGNTGERAYIYYILQDYMSGSYSEGMGYIPSSDFKGTWSTGLSLNTDSSRIDGTVTGSSGAITLECKPNLYAPNWGWNEITTTAGTKEVVYGTTVIRTSGITSQGAAYCQGTVLGQTMNDPNMAFSMMGESHNVTVTLTK